MLAHYTYAVISNGIVQNIMVCSDIALANQIAMATYGEEGFAIEVSYISCAIGDKYESGRFYHTDENGTVTVVEELPTEKEEIAKLKSLNNSLTLALAELIGA